MNELGLSTSFGIGSTRILQRWGVKKTSLQEFTEHYRTKLRISLRVVRFEKFLYRAKTATRLAEWGINTMSEAAEYGEILARFTSERFASWMFGSWKAKLAMMLAR